MNTIEIDELEMQSFLQWKMYERDIMNARQKMKNRPAAAAAAAAAANNPVPGSANGSPRTPHSASSSSVYRSQHVNGNAASVAGLSNGVGGNGVVVNGRLTGATSSPHVPVTSTAVAAAAYSMSNGAYVEYGNGANLMPVSSSSVVSLQQQYGAVGHAHAAYTNGQSNGSAGANASFFATVAASAAGSPGPQFHQMAAAAAVHSASSAGFGSPNGQHIYQKFNHLAMSSPHSGLANGRTLNGTANGNGLSMSPSDYQSVALDKDRRHLASAATAIVANRY